MQRDADTISVDIRNQKRQKLRIAIAALERGLSSNISAGENPEQGSNILGSSAACGTTHLVREPIHPATEDKDRGTLEGRKSLPAEDVSTRGIEAVAAIPEADTINKDSYNDFTYDRASGIFVLG